MPPIKEQKDVFSRIENESMKIDRAIAKAEKQMALARDYLHSLIFQVVTNGGRAICNHDAKESGIETGFSKKPGFLCTHQTMKLKVIIHEAEEGGLRAEVPAIPGCVTRPVRCRGRVSLALTWIRLHDSRRNLLT